MRKLLLLITLTLASLIASSQSVTKTTTIDSIVPLPKNVAREVVKDIIRKDSLETELKVLNENYKLLENNSTIKDSVIQSKDGVINLWKDKEKNYLSIIDLKEQQKTNLETLTTSLAADLRQLKRKRTTTTIILSAIIGGLTYLYIAK